MIHDPRSSTPGLGLLLWVKAAYGDRAPEIWEGLAPRIVTVTPGWSEAYGLFLDGEVDMALAYTTSPAYHLIAEDDPTKRAAIFDEGHYMQVEVAGMTAASDQPDLARDFLGFMLTDAFQSVHPHHQLDVSRRTCPKPGCPPASKPSPRPRSPCCSRPEEARDQRDAALDEWLRALSR